MDRHEEAQGNQKRVHSSDGETSDKKPRVEHQSASELTEVDLAPEMMGNNQLHGDDQQNVRNERHAQPGVRTEPDANVRDRLERTDKHVRAKRDLGERS